MSGLKKRSINPKRDRVETVVIIPARGGQQSIPRKNLQKVGSKSLLAWAIDVAIEAGEVDAVIVSTEDAEIAAAAEKMGAIVAPRPKKYSRPSSGDAGFYHHAVVWMEREFGWQPELLVNLRPTGPLRFAEDLDAMVRYMKKSGADGVKSVIPAPLHPYKMWTMENSSSKSKGKIGAAGKLVPVFDNDYRRQRGSDQPRQKIQEMFPVYWQDAQIDITRRKFVIDPKCLELDNVWGQNLHGYILDERTSVDLDTPEDFRQAAKVYLEIVSKKKD